jgi:hypothetical protein
VPRPARRPNRPTRRRIRRRTVCRVLAATAATAALIALPVGPAGADGELGGGVVSRLGAALTPVVVVGTGGVRWADVTPATAPHLAGLAATGAIADVTVRGVRTSACPVDGWLALSAGRRAGEPDQPALPEPLRPPCRAIKVRADVGGQGGANASDGGAATVTTWPRYVEAARAGTYGAEPGLLGGALRSAITCASAIGPGAGVALAAPDGVVARYRANLPPAPALRALLADQTCPLTVIDARAVRDPQDAPAGAIEVGIAPAPGNRVAQLRAVDATVGAVLAAAPANARVLVVSLADGGRTPRLQLAAARGPGFGPGLLRTPSTRQVALVQATDLTPTVLALLRVPAPVGLVGAPLQTLAAPGDAPGTTAGRLRKVADLDRSATEIQDLVAPFFNGLVIAQLLLYGAAAVVLRGRRAAGAWRRLLLGGVRRAALLFACAPVATYLANTVPWWRADRPLPVLVGVVLGYVVLVAGVAWLGPWRRRALGPFGAVAGLTSTVLAADITTGSRLQTASLMGLQPVVGGRFYGFGNVSFALFATGALLLATAWADQLVRRGRRRAAGLAVAGVGAVAIALDVSPAWGSDFGGPIAMVPAFALLTLLVLGVRLSLARLTAIGLGTALLLGSVSISDWLRPADDRTHLGRFVQTVLDGGAWQVVSRKAEQNVSILFGSVLSILVPFAALFLALVLMRPSSWGAPALARAYDRSPVLRPGLTCLLVLLGIGFATNDSGTAIPAVGATLAVPLIIAASMRALVDDERGPRRLGHRSD